MEKIHDEVGDLVYGRGNFTPMPPANERQRFADEARLAAERSRGRGTRRTRARK